MITRHHFGSSLAFLLSLYNLFLLRQKILKNAIYFSKSNKPYIVKPVSIAIGICYFVGLYSIWHIPSLGAEAAVRIYVAS